MARRKEFTGQAFKSKSVAEETKLCQSLSQQLSTDMCRLLAEGTHSDLSLSLKGRQYQLHKFILKARCGHLYDKLLQICENPTDWSKNLTDSDVREFDTLLRLIYSTDHLTAVNSKLDAYLNSSESLHLNPEICVADLQRNKVTEGEGHGDTSCEGQKDDTIQQKPSPDLLQAGNGDVSASDGCLSSQGQVVITNGEVRGGDVTQEGTDGVVSADMNGSKDRNAAVCTDTENGLGDHAQDVENKDTTALTFTTATNRKIDPHADIGACNGAESGSHVCESSPQTTELLGNDSAQGVCASSDIERDVSRNGLTADINREIDVESCKALASLNIGDEKENTKSNDNSCNTGDESKGMPIEDPTSSPAIDSAPDYAPVPLSSLVKDVYGFNMEVLPCSRLGEDLLRMLLLGEHCDCVIAIGDKELPAHKCILSARSNFFEAMLSGSWHETETDILTLEGVSEEILKQTLLFLYGGVLKIDNSVSIASFLKTADMYNMESLKEVIHFDLRKDECHFFHKPCPTCIAGVPATLAISMMFNLTELKDNCLDWICKNFEKVWPTKYFACQPREVLDLCVTYTISSLTADTVINIMLDCRKLNDQVPHLKWTEPVFDMIIQLLDASIEFSSKNFERLITFESFVKVEKRGIVFLRSPLEEIFSMVITSLTASTAIKAYISLMCWENETLTEDSGFSQECVEFGQALLKKCKDHLCQYINLAINTQEWSLLDKSQQNNLMIDASFVCFDPSKSRVAPPKLSSDRKKGPPYRSGHPSASPSQPALPREKSSRETKAREQKINSSRETKAREQKVDKYSKSSAPVPAPQGRPKDSSENKSRNRFIPKPQEKKKSSNQTIKSSSSKKQSDVLPSTLHRHDSAEHVSALGAVGGEAEPRERSHSTGASSLLEPFNRDQKLQAARSVDSLFVNNSTAGQSTLPKLLPNLKVNFIVPREFHEDF